MASYINFEKRKYINFCRKRAKDFVLENIILFKERTMTETRNTIFSYASHVTFFFLKKNDGKMTSLFRFYISSAPQNKMFRKYSINSRS